MINEDKFHKWVHIIMVVLLAVLAICRAILICINHKWGYIPCGLLAIVLFAFLYSILLLSKYLAKIITFACVQSYKNNIVPRIEVNAINRYIQEHGIVEEKPKTVEQLTEQNETKNQQQRLEQFMKTIKEERNAYLVIKEKEDAEKLKKILQYVRSTLMPFDFTDEELFQICECVRNLVVDRIVIPTVPVKIEKIGKKALLTQFDLGNFAWNIAHQYGISNTLAANFLLFTFRDWYKFSESTTIAKNLKSTKGKHYNIVSDENILDEV